MTTSKAASILFYLAAAYDFILGIVILFVAPALFEAMKDPPPNHWGYVEFPALVFMIFGVMFYQIAQKPEHNRNLIPYGAMMKLAFAGVVIWHWLVKQNMPTILKPCAIIDVVFLVAMLWALNAINKTMKPMQTY